MFVGVFGIFKRKPYSYILALRLDMNKIKELLIMGIWVSEGSLPKAFSQNAKLNIVGL